MHKQRLYDELCDELEKISEGGVTAGNLEAIDKLTHSIKSLGTIIAMEEYDDGHTRGYDRGYSYVRRDSRGRYARDSHKDKMVMELEELMHDAPDEKSRKAIERAIMQLHD